MKKQIITLALLLLTGAGAAQAQDCCQGSEKKECCQKAAIETVVPLNICIIGYPDELPTPKDKWKPENVSYNKFGAK